MEGADVVGVGWGLVEAEAEDVELGEADVLDELPGGPGEAGGDLAAEAGGEGFDGVVEGGVGVASF